MGKTQRKNSKKNRFSSLILILICALIGFFCGIAIGKLSSALPHSPFFEGQFLLRWAAALVIICIALFLQTVIHEAGHLVAGLLSGYTFSSFRIGSFMWVKEQGKIKFRRLSVAGTGGQCLMNPPDLVDGKVPVVLYNLGGPLMNLATVPVCVALYFLFNDNFILSLFFLMLYLTGFALALTNGIPLKCGLINNDGYNALELSKSPEASYSFWLQMKINEQISKGIRLKDMPQEWFVLPDDNHMKNSMIASIAVFYANRLLDNLAFEDVIPLIDRLLSSNSGILPLHRYLLICDRLYCELIGENDKAVIDRLYTKELKKFMKQMHTFPSVIRTQYAYALFYEHNAEKAAALKKLFGKCGKKHPYAVEIESEQELLDIAAQKYGELIKKHSG